MKKLIGRLMAMCFLALSVAAFAQSGGNMQQDQMGHNQTKHDTMKKDDMSHDTMAKKKTKKKTKKSTMANSMKKKDNMKKDNMKKDNMKPDNMGHENIEELACQSNHFERPAHAPMRRSYPHAQDFSLKIPDYPVKG